MKINKSEIKERAVELKQIAIQGFRLIKLIVNEIPKSFLLLTLTFVLVGLLPFATSFISAKIIDQLTVVVSRGVSTFPNNLLFLVLLYLGVLGLRRVNTSLNNYFDVTFYYDLDKLVTLTLSKKYSELDLEYYENPEFNDLLQSVKENRSQNRIFIKYLLRSIGDVISFLAAVGILLSFSPLILIIIVGANIPQFIAEAVLGRKVWGIWRANAELKRNYYDTKRHLTSEESLKEIKVFGTQDFFIQKVKNLFVNFQNEQKKLEKKRVIANILVNLLTLIGFGYAYFFTISSVLNGAVTIGLFTFYISSINKISSATSSLFNYYSSIYESGLFVVDFFKVLDLEKRVKEGDVKINKKNTPPNIEFNNVSFEYPNSEKFVFEDFNLKINSGEHIAIVGENGAGKSTLIKLLQRFYDPTKGQILVNGTDLKKVDLDSWYKQLASLTQDYIKYHFDAKTNIGLGNIEKINDFESVKSAAKMSGAHEFIKDYDDKYNRYLSKRYPGGINPSEGQWQKIALARAFFKDASILILDEPTSAIDPKSEFEIFEKLFDFAEDKTVIIISHRFSTVRNADRIIVLDDGKVVEQGSHKELIENKGMYKEAFDLQKKGYEDI